MRRDLPLWLCLAPILLGVAGVARGGALAGSMLAGQLWWGLASLTWLGLVVAIARRPGRAGRWTWALILGGAIGLRLIALGGAPELSDDVHRYVWEGALVAEGKSPYGLAPAAPERAAERARWPTLFASINHPEVPAAYPPWTQVSCAAVVWASGGTRPLDAGRAERSMRVFFSLCDLAVLLPLGLLLRRGGRDPRLLVAWAWSPLVVLEFASGTHFDALGILLLFSAIACVELGRGPGLAAFMWMGGVLVKGLPLAFLPGILRVVRERRRFTLVAVLTLVLSIVPFLFLEGARSGSTRGLAEYAFRWEAASLVYRWVERPFALLYERDESLTDPRRLARALVILAFLLVVLQSWRLRERPARASRRLLGAFLFLTPTLHPWYACWLVPALVLHPSRAWSLLIALAPLLYWPLAAWWSEGVWREPAWLWPVLVLPFAALFWLERRASRRGTVRHETPLQAP